MGTTTKFEGYDEFIVTDEMTLEIVLPTQVKIIDTGKMLKVDLEAMHVVGDAENATLKLKEKGRCFTRATFQIFAYVMLQALNGQRKVSTVLRWINEVSLFIETISSVLAGEKITAIVQSMYNFYAKDKSASQAKLLRSALKFWIQQGVPGVHPALASYLQTSKSPKPRSTTEIQNTTPAERPFTIAQVRCLLSDIDSLYSRHVFDPQDNLLWRLIISEAMRPAQLKLLQIGDVSIVRDAQGKVSDANMLVPFVKQAGTPAREYMVSYPVSEPVARALDEHLTFVAEHFDGSLPANLPLFCIVRKFNTDPSIQTKSIKIDYLIKRTRAHIASMSNELVHTDLFTRRFKHTKLTHLAFLGASIDVLARAGFQTSNVSLRHYVNLSDEAFEAYEQAMESEHGIIFEALKPAVVAKQDASNPSPDNIILDRSMAKELGSCSHLPCNVLAPYGCYICSRFEAFEDGPHEVVEADLVARRQCALDMDLPRESVSRDDHILAAVRQVITLIQVRKDVSE